MGLTTKQKAGYGIGAVGKDIVYALVSGFLLYYYNNILGISGTFTGIMMMAARIFDAFNDPFMGIVVEKTRTRYGKFRPWIMTGTVTNALILYGMFAMPESIKGNAMLFYATIAYFLWGITYTIMDIPFWSMIPAITSTGKEREGLSVIGRSCSSVGFAIPTVLTVLVVPMLGETERQGYAVYAGIIAAVFIVTELICVLCVKEREIVETEKKETVTVKKMIGSLLQNDQALVVVVGIIVFNASLYLTTQLALYFFEYDIGNKELYSLFGTIGGVGQILSMMSLPVLRKKWSCKKILGGAICVTIFGYGLLFLLSTIGVTAVPLLGLCAFIIYIGFGLATVLTTVFLADAVDYGEYKTGQRNESVIFSMQTFVVKLASAISVLIAGIGIDAIGIDTRLEQQSAGTLLGLRCLMIVVPMIGLIFSVLFFQKKYKLTEEKNQEIAAELAKRKGE